MRVFYYIAKIILAQAAIFLALAAPTSVRAQAPADTAGVTWLVPPIHAHGQITFCWVCGFINGHGLLIDPVTGELTGEERWGHGIGAPVYFVYDPALGLFGEPILDPFGYTGQKGMHPFAERFEVGEWNWLLQNRLVSVQAVDSTLRSHIPWREPFRDIYGNIIDEWILLPEAFSGTFALMYDGEFITDFIFDGGMSVDLPRSEIPVAMGGRWGMVDTRGEVVVPFMYDALYTQYNRDDFFLRPHGFFGQPNDKVIAVYRGKHGLIDIRGNVLLPHIFEEIVLINSYSAFAMVGGLHGIVAIPAEPIPVGLMPQTGGGGFLIFHLLVLAIALVGVGVNRIIWSENFMKVGGAR